MTIYLASLSAALFVAVAAPAMAAPQQLSIGDLDLSRPADVQTFRARIDAVTDQMCKEVEVTGTRITSQRACRRAVEGEVLSKLSASQRQALADSAKAKPAGKTDALAAGVQTDGHAPS